MNNLTRLPNTSFLMSAARLITNFDCGDPAVTRLSRAPASSIDRDVSGFTPARTPSTDLVSAGGSRSFEIYSDGTSNIIMAQNMDSNSRKYTTVKMTDQNPAGNTHNFKRIFLKYVTTQVSQFFKLTTFYAFPDCTGLIHLLLFASFILNSKYYV